jgi:GNAT superfamily N-acetyltransferase
MKLIFHPLTEERWPDLETLFGANGACGGCWCMSWRLSRAQFDANKGAGNKRAIKKLLKEGTVPGLLAYDGKEPVGWIAVGPREDFVRLAASRVLKPVDKQPVWSIVCFFVTKAARHKGVSVALIKAAADYVKRQGGLIVEGYPTEAMAEQPAPFVWTGLASAFCEAGFEEALRRSKSRPIMRKTLKKSEKQ